jgi:hypothetical protein
MTISSSASMIKPFKRKGGNSNILKRIVKLISWDRNTMNRKIENRIMTDRKIENRIIVTIVLFTAILSACTASPPPTNQAPTLARPTATLTLTPTAPPPAFTPDASQFAFPAAIDPAQRYLFYLHGKIIEDQGLPAVSPDFGEYEYAAILNRFREAGFTVISEVRPKNADANTYAKKVAGQITQLLGAGVPAEQISVVGASKGSYMAIAVSYLLKNERLNFVLLGSCSPDEIPLLEQKQMPLYGNVLSIYDSADNLSGSCADFFTYSTGKGLARHDEIVLHVGTGHGILYKPLDEWVLPTIEWAK